FRPDGTFLFTPSPMAQVRTDIYPIVGTYSRTGNVITFQGGKESSLSSDFRANASLNGMIHLSEKNILLEVVDVTASYTRYREKISDKRQVAKITQQLSQQPIKAPRVEIVGIQVPTIFRITLEGNLEE